MLFSETARKRRLDSANGIGDWQRYKTFRQGIWNFFQLLIEVEVHGVENIPAPEGTVRGLDYYPPPYSRFGESKIDTHPYVAASNHSSLFDIPAIGAMKRPKAIVGKAPFAMTPIIREWFFCRGLVPIRRKKDFRSRLGPLMVKWRMAVTYTPAEMWDVCQAALERGIPVEIYASGSRSDPSTKIGPFVLACRAGVPIVPMAVSGCKKRKRDGEPITKVGLIRRRIVVLIGEPIMPPHVGAGRVPDEALEDMMQEWEHQVYEVLLPKADAIRKREL